MKNRKRTPLQTALAVEKTINQIKKSRKPYNQDIVSIVCDKNKVSASYIKQLTGWK